MESQLIHAFIRRKGWRMMWEKNKSTTPSLAFAFALNLNKIGNFSEKNRYVLWRIWNKAYMLKWVSRMFPKLSMTNF